MEQWKETEFVSIDIDNTVWKKTSRGFLLGIIQIFVQRIGLHH